MSSGRPRPDARGTDRDAGSSTVDRSPARLSAGLAILAALLAVGIVGARVEVALYVGSAGVVLVAFGTLAGARARVGQGVLVLFAAITVAGATGLDPGSMVPATLCALLALDAGGYGITVGEQLGRAADTRRAELVHATLTVAVGAIGATIGYGAFLAAAGDQPTLAVVLLFAGAAALVAAVGSEGSLR